MSWGRIVRNLGRIFLLDLLSASKDTFHLEVGNYWRVLSKIKIEQMGKLTRVKGLALGSIPSVRQIQVYNAHLLTFNPVSFHYITFTNFVLYFTSEKQSLLHAIRP